MLSSAYAVWTKSSKALIGRFRPNNVRLPWSFSNYVWKLLSCTCVKYSIDAYHKYILPFVLGNLSSRDYQSDPSNVMFPRFPVSYHFPWCFRLCLLVFLRFLPVFLLFPCSISPVSYFRFCVLYMVWYLIWHKIFKIKKNFSNRFNFIYRQNLSIGFSQVVAVSKWKKWMVKSIYTLFL